MKKSLLILKTALVFGFLLQPGYAMEDEEAEEIKGAIGNILTPQLAMATLITEQMDQAGIFDRSAARRMRAGQSSVEVEYEEQRKTNVKAAMTIALTQEGVKFVRDELYKNLSEHDKAIVDSLSNHKW